MTREVTDAADEADGTDGSTDEDGTDRYAELNINEQFVIYDRENHQAWLQSSAAVSVADRR